MENIESVAGSSELQGTAPEAIIPWQMPVSDILTYIFLSCLPEDQLVEPKVTEAPLNVSQVCRGWRDLALSMGRLWSRFQLVIQPRDQSVPGHVLPTLKEWLRRSGAADVKISIRCIKAAPFSDIEKGIWFIPANGFGSSK